MGRQISDLFEEYGARSSSQAACDTVRSVKPNHATLLYRVQYTLFLTVYVMGLLLARIWFEIRQEWIFKMIGHRQMPQVMELARFLVQPVVIWAAALLPFVLLWRVWCRPISVWHVTGQTLLLIVALGYAAIVPLEIESTCATIVVNMAVKAKEWGLIE